jgi:hypothetical protein
MLAMMLTNDVDNVIRDIYGGVKFYVMTRLETQFDVWHHFLHMETNDKHFNLVCWTLSGRWCDKWKLPMLPFSITICVVVHCYGPSEVHAKSNVEDWSLYVKCQTFVEMKTWWAFKAWLICISGKNMKM